MEKIICTFSTNLILLNTVSITKHLIISKQFGKEETDKVENRVEEDFCQLTSSLFENV